LFGDRVRGHSLRELLGILSRSLERHGYVELAGEIRSFVGEHRGLREKKSLYRRILERAIDVYGLPWDAPVELHIADEREAEEYLKLSRRAVRINP